MKTSALKALCAAVLSAIIIAAASCGKTYPAHSEKDIEKFLSEHGIETAGKSTIKTVTIPAEFGAVYERYNELQKRQGFDLTAYRSREATVYTFGVVSVDDKHTDLTEAHVMVCDDAVIGGDVSSYAIDGGMDVIIGDRG